MIILLHPLPAHALSSLCQQVLPVPPVSSHYVQRVMDRANGALAAMGNQNQGMPLILSPWVQNVFSTIVTLIDVSRRLTVHSLSLEDQTSCLSLDAFLLHCQMEQVMDSLHVSLTSGSWVDILKKQSLLLFLDERLKHLLAGASDPVYLDTTWGQQHLFDTSAPQSNPICPFHTDYSEAQQASGCDLSILASRRAYPPIAAEARALENIGQNIEHARADALELLQLQRDIAQLSGRPQPPSPPSTVPSHSATVGCHAPGFCALDPDQGCTETSQCAARSLGDCIPKRRQQRTALRGPFALSDDLLRLLRRFLEQKVQEGGSREYSRELKLPEEFDPGETTLRQARERAQPFEGPTRNSWRLLTRIWSRLQAAFEAAIFPRSTDVPLMVLEETGVLRTEAARLATLSSTPTGLRAFITKYAYFLRRSCIFRPCRAQLERVLKISAADECFPYTDGRFLRDSEAVPRWRLCAADACLRGAEISDGELPVKCEGIP